MQFLLHFSYARLNNPRQQFLPVFSFHLWHYKCRLYLAWVSGKLQSWARFYRCFLCSSDPDRVGYQA
jgi:hypothetical protein